MHQAQREGPHNENAMYFVFCSIQSGIFWYLTFACIDLCIEL